MPVITEKVNPETKRPEAIEHRTLKNLLEA